MLHATSRMEFYKLDITGSQFNRDGFYYSEPVGKCKLGEFPTCPDCSAHIGILPWLPPYTIRIKGKQAGDIIAGAGRSFLVSPRFMNALDPAMLTDVETLGAMDCKTNSSIIATYTHLHPPTVVARMDESATTFDVHKLVGCDTCRTAQRSRVDGFRVDESSWGGQHFFYPSGLYGVLLVTETVANALTAAKLDNVHLIHQDNYHEEYDR